MSDDRYIPPVADLLKSKYNTEPQVAGEFKKYNSIENSYRTKTLEQIQIQHPGELYVVQEKVHGANFAIYVNGTEIRFAKRSGFIGKDEKFYNYTRLELPNFLKNGPICDHLVFHGEIYGGNYPHPDVKPVDTSIVQKGVFYSPDVHFICFDAKINDRLLDQNEFEALCEMYNVPYLKRLMTGTLEECLEYNNLFQSTIPTEYHNLPEIENNTCEGVVIKPLKALYFSNGERVILKNKNKKFTEKEGTKKSHKPVELPPDHIVSIIEEASAYVCENRLRNVISKVGSIETKDFGKLLHLMSKDIIEDFIKDNEVFNTLDKKDCRLITKSINKMLAKLIRDNFVNITDGTF